jgi:hypothetical protein
MLRNFVLLVGLAAGASPALAKRDAPPPARAAQRFDFDDDEVIATPAAPNETRVDGRVAPSHPSLIRVRTSFRPELLKSAEDR